MSNKFDSYDVVRFHQIDSITNQVQEFEGVVGGFSRTEPDGYVYQVYVPEKETSFNVQERSLTRVRRISPAEYRQMVVQKTPSAPLPRAGNFTVQESSSIASPQISRSAPSPTHSEFALSSNRYPALRGLASLASLLAQLSVVAAIIGVVGGLIATGTPFVGAIGWVIVLLSIWGGAISYFVFQAAAESIHVLLDMENNTRESASYLRQAVVLLDERLGSK